MPIVPIEGNVKLFKTRNLPNLDAYNINDINREDGIFSLLCADTVFFPGFTNI